MRLSVRYGVEVFHSSTKLLPASGFSRAVGCELDAGKNPTLCQNIPVSPDKRIPQRVFGSVKQKRNLCPVRTDNVTATACVAASTSVCRNINLLPFRRCLAITRRLRNDSPTLNQCSRGTLPRFALQGSHLNICYYHQDLH